MNSARQHTDGTHSDDTPTESMVTTHIVAPGPLLPPTPIVLNRRADDTAFMSPETLAAKLAKVGHVSPDIQMSSEEARARARAMAKVTPVPRQQFICITMDCQAVSDRPGACDKCQSDIADGKFDAIGWEKILVWSLIALSLVVSAALVWKEIFG